MGSWLASPPKEGVVGMVVCNTGQPRMWEVKIVEGNQCHGKIIGRRDQFGPKCCGEICLATALRTLYPHDERFIWPNPLSKVFQHMSQHVPGGGFHHSRETRRGQNRVENLGRSGPGIRLG